LKRTRPKVSTKIKRVPKRNYTPESPIVRIVSAKKLDVWEATAAMDVLIANRRVNGLSSSADIELDIREPTEFDAVENRVVTSMDLTSVYSQWRKDLRDTVALRVADLIMFKEQPLTTVDEANRWPRGTALEHLTIALRHFAVLRGNAPPGFTRKWRWTST
jgi:hypothetical protein